MFWISPLYFYLIRLYFLDQKVQPKTVEKPAPFKKKGNHDLPEKGE